jgi:hypothetical protein
MSEGERKRTPTPTPIVQTGGAEAAPAENVPPGAKTDLHGKLADLRAMEKAGAEPEVIGQVLAELETMTWSAEDPSVLNLLIVLRRKYEGCVEAANKATTSAVEVAGSGRFAVSAAIIVALVGWAVVIASVIYLALSKSPFPSIQTVWPALAATSGAVLLLIGVATLAFRYAQRSHDRAMLHHADARRTRRLETAVRMVMVEGLGADPVKAFAARLLEDPSYSRSDKPDEISSLPEGVGSALEKVAGDLGGAVKDLASLANAVRGKPGS